MFDNKILCFFVSLNSNGISNLSTLILLIILVINSAFFPEVGKLCLDNIVFNSTTLRYDKVLFLVKYPNLYN